MADQAMGRDQFQAMIKGKSDAELLEGCKGNEEGFIDAIISAMPAAFVAAKAGTQSAIFQYDIDTPAGLKQYQIIVDNGKCTTQKGAGAKAKVTLKCNLPNFLRIMSGELDGQKAFMSGALKISGDIMFSRNMAIWFKG